MLFRDCNNLLQNNQLENALFVIKSVIDVMN